MLISSFTPDICNGEFIAGQLGEIGIPCHYINTIDSPSAYIHNFSINNIRDILKLEKAKKILSVYFKTVVNYSEAQTDSSAPYSADFSIIFDKPFSNSIYWQDYKKAVKKPFDFLIGVDTLNAEIVANLADLPHLLIAGETGAGKSVVLHSILNSLLSYKGLSNEKDLGLILIDTKRTELTQYQNSDFLACPISTDYRTAYSTIYNLMYEMDERYKIMAKNGVSECTFARLVLVIDELADLMLRNKKVVEPMIVRLAQMGRAANIHLILATQRPTVDVCTGHIKANIPSRIALQVASARDSMNIIDRKGAETLKGKGDALIKLSYENKIRRLQCFNYKK